jgi:hypothetical protein
MLLTCYIEKNAGGPENVIKFRSVLQLTWLTFLNGGITIILDLHGPYISSGHIETGLSNLSFTGNRIFQFPI